MIIKPRVRGFLCITTHPVGCEANVKRQMDYVKSRGPIADGPKRVLVIGSSTGYGLSSRITAAFGAGASTLGIFFEKEGTEKKPGTAGWYNSAAFHKFAEADGLYAKSINGDAFSDEIKQKTIATIKEDLGQIDLVVYSLAAPRRQHPVTGVVYNSAAFHKFAEADGLYAKSINGDAFSDEIKQKAIATIKEDLGQIDLVVYSLAAPRRQHPVTGVVYNSTLKPIGGPTVQKGVNTDKEQVQDFHIEEASQEDIDNTVAVMGGEDWQMWIEALDEAGVLAAGAKTTAYTYIGEKLTWDIYWHGTIGAAKKDLDKRVIDIRKQLAAKGGDARVSVLKAVVTQASAAIPAMPIYLALLFKVMKEQGIHEGCIEQVDGLFRDSLYGADPYLDEEGRLRADRKELAPEIQAAVAALWDDISTDNLRQLSDFEGYKREFLQLFGFEVDGVDYEADVDTAVTISNMV